MKHSYNLYNIRISHALHAVQDSLTIYYALNFSRIRSLEHSQVSEAPTVGQSWLVHLQKKGEGQGGAGKGTYTMYREGPNSLHRSKTHKALTIFNVY